MVKPCSVMLILFLGASGANVEVQPSNVPLTSLVTQLGHNDIVLAKAFSPDGRFLLTVSRDQTAVLWEVATGAEVRRYLDESGVVAAAFFSDNARVLIVTGKGALQVRDLTTNREITRIETQTETTRAALARNGLQVLVASEGHVAIWDLTTASRVANVGARNYVADLAWSPDGRSVAFTSRRSHYEDDQPGPTQVYDVATGAVRTLSGHTNSVMSLSFSADGTRVVTGSIDHTARVWDASTGRELLVLRAAAKLYGAAFSPDSHLIFTTDPSAVRSRPTTEAAEPQGRRR